jgi:hypothetical protein
MIVTTTNTMKENVQQLSVQIQQEDGITRTIEIISNLMETKPQWKSVVQGPTESQLPWKAENRVVPSTKQDYLWLVENHWIPFTVQDVNDHFS